MAATSSGVTASGSMRDASMRLQEFRDERVSLTGSEIKRVSSDALSISCHRSPRPSTQLWHWEVRWHTPQSDPHSYPLDLRLWTRRPKLPSLWRMCWIYPLSAKPVDCVLKDAYTLCSYSRTKSYVLLLLPAGAYSLTSPLQSPLAKFGSRESGFFNSAPNPVSSSQGHMISGGGCVDSNELFTLNTQIPHTTIRPHSLNLLGF